MRVGWDLDIGKHICLHLDVYSSTCLFEVIGLYDDVDEARTRGWLYFKRMDLVVSMNAKGWASVVTNCAASGR